jgi:hypothetical protein
LLKPNHPKQVRRLAQKEFMTVEDEAKVLPTRAAGLALHMGDVTAPHPVAFRSSGSGGGGGGGSSGGIRGSSSGGGSSGHALNFRASDWAGAAAVGPQRAGRSLAAFVAALEAARAEVQGSRDKVSCVA